MVTRTKKIFVGGLSAQSTLEDVKNYFEQFGKVRKTDRQEGKMERWNFSNRAEKGDIGCLTLKGCHNECASRLLTHLCCLAELQLPEYDILWRVPYSARTGNGPCSSRRRKEYNGRTDKAGHIFLLLAAL